jgi:hypothetical protein
MRRAVLLSAPGGAENTTLRCGLTLHETRRTGIHSHVELREYELQDGKLKIAATLASGWLASMDLSASVERHFYHIELTGPAPDKWTWFAEGEHNFQCYWVPLSEDPG